MKYRQLFTDYYYDYKNEFSLTKLVMTLQTLSIDEEVICYNEKLEKMEGEIRELKK